MSDGCSKINEGLELHWWRLPGGPPGTPCECGERKRSHSHLHEGEAVWPDAADDARRTGDAS